MRSDDSFSNDRLQPRVNQTANVSSVLTPFLFLPFSWDVIRYFVLQRNFEYPLLIKLDFVAELKDYVISM